MLVSLFVEFEWSICCLVTSNLRCYNFNKHKHQIQRPCVSNYQHKCIIQLKEFVQNMHQVMIESNQNTRWNNDDQDLSDDFASQTEMYAFDMMHDIANIRMPDNAILQFVGTSIDFDQFYLNIFILSRPQRNPAIKKKNCFVWSETFN